MKKIKEVLAKMSPSTKAILLLVGVALGVLSYILANN